MQAKYKLRFFFDYGCSTPLWSADDASRARFGYPVELAGLPISEETRRNISSLCEWFDRSLNQDYPPDPGNWQQAECDRFNLEAVTLLERCRAELGADFELVDEFDRLAADFDLDAVRCFDKGLLP